MFIMQFDNKDSGAILQQAASEQNASALSQSDLKRTAEEHTHNIENGKRPRQDKEEDGSARQSQVQPVSERSVGIGAYVNEELVPIQGGIIKQRNVHPQKIIQVTNGFSLGFQTFMYMKKPTARSVTSHHWIPLPRQKVAQGCMRPCKRNELNMGMHQGF